MRLGNFRENLRDASREGTKIRYIASFDLDIHISTRDSLRYEVVHYFQRRPLVAAGNEGILFSYEKQLIELSSCSNKNLLLHVKKILFIIEVSRHNDCHEYL